MARDRKTTGKRATPIKGDKAKLAKLAELEKTNKELASRFKVSNKLFQKRDKLKQQLGIEINHED